MRKEYQAIVDFVSDYYNMRMSDERAALRSVAERCQALADKPPKMLNVKDISVVWGKTCHTDWSYQEFARAIEAAHIAKQKEPETRKVKIALYKLENGKIISATEDEVIGDRAIVLEEFEHEVTI